MSFTIPNLLTVLRIGLVPLFLMLLVRGDVRGALLIVVVAGVSDALDGFIARFFHQQSQLGTYLDPLADKVLLTSAYIALAIPGLHPGLRIPVWVTTLVIVRDLLLVLAALTLYLLAGVRKFPPTLLSKVTTMFQVAAVLLVLLSSFWPALEPAARLTIYAVAALTLASGFNYVYRINRLIESRPAPGPASARHEAPRAADSSGAPGEGAPRG